MEFKTLFPILRKYMADGDDVPTFFRELMATITTVSEEEWGTSKDPSAKLSDETIRSYTKRKLPKKLASTIVYRLTPDRLTKRIKRLKNATRELFAADLKAYDSTITADNIGEKGCPPAAVPPSAPSSRSPPSNPRKRLYIQESRWRTIWPGGS